MLQEFEPIFLGAIIASMLVIRRFVRGELTDEESAQVKDDGTVKVLCDTKSGEAARDVLKVLPVDLFGLRFEDVKSGRKTNPNAPFRALCDHQDGSRDFMNGGSPTVILGIEDRGTNRYVKSYICEVANGRILSADQETPTQRIWYRDGQLSEPEPVNVCGGKLDGQATVYIDPFEVGFPLRRTQYGKLVEQIMALGSSDDKPDDAVHVLIKGGNGLHQLLVANGWRGALGTVTTAKGDSWDTGPGGQLISRSNGFAVGLEITPDGKLIRKNPLHTAKDHFHFLAAGNSEETIEGLVGALELCLQY